MSDSKKNSASNFQRKRSSSPSRSPSHKKLEKLKPESSVNIVHYDPELHWCSLCGTFPRTATEFLFHLHTDEHKRSLKAKKDKPEEEFMPWRVHEPREASPPMYKNAPSKRVPLRGVQFLVPSTAWYCSLCKSWIGDIEAAHHHLRGQKHATNYQEFTALNPHWEVDWLTDRTRAYERNSDAKSRAIDEPAPSPSKDKKDPVPAPNPPLDMEQLLGDRLLAMIAATAKGKNRSKSSGSSSRSSSRSSDSSRGKKKDRKKKTKDKKEKKKNKEIYKEPDKPKIPDNYVYEESEETKDRNKQKRRTRDEYDRRERRRESSRDRRGSSSDRTRRSDRSSRDSRSRNPAQPKSEDHHGSKAPSKAQWTVEAKEEPKPAMEKNPVPKGKLYFPGKDDDEDKEETVFEKKTAESAAKMKEVKKTINNFTISKSKLPFIGRMPWTKKKVEVPKTETKDEKPAEQPPPQQQQQQQPAAMAEKVDVPQPVPPVSEVPKLGAAKDETVSDIFPNNLPKSTLVISKRPPLSVDAVPKEVPKLAEDNMQEQDMDIDDEPQRETVVEENVQDIGIPSEVPLPPEKNELQQDFKDALDLLFPEQQPEDDKPKEAEVPVEPQPVAQFSYDTAFPPPQVPYYDQYLQQGYAPVGPPGFGMEFSQPPPGVPPVPPGVPPVPPSEPALQAGIPPPGDPNLQMPPNGPEADPPKKKNPPGQRLRRFLKKKREEAERNKKEELHATNPPLVPNDPPPVPPPPPKFKPEEMSELALLGIEEDDITAQFF